MDRVIEFAMNHPFLVGGFLGLLSAFIFLETRRGGKSVSSQQLTNLVNKEEALVLDVRDAKEFKEGHITGSKNIQRKGHVHSTTQIHKATKRLQCTKYPIPQA